MLELRCVIHQQMGHWVEAANAFNALCARRDADVEHFIGWGCCLYELGAYEEARQALLTAPKALQLNGLWNFHLACYEALVGLPKPHGNGSNWPYASIPASSTWPSRIRGWLRCSGPFPEFPARWETADEKGCVEIDSAAADLSLPSAQGG